MEGTTVMSVRIPTPVHSWLRKRAAELTIERDRQVSMSGLIVEILTRAKEEDEGGD